MPDRVLDVQVQGGSGVSQGQHVHEHQHEPKLWPPTWPMGLTMLRLLLLPAFLWFLLSGYRWAALGIFAVMALTDKLDGWLARRLNQTSKLGTLLDPLADKLLIACSLILLSFEQVAPRGFSIPIWVVLAVYAKDLVIGAGTLALLSMVGKVSIQPRWLGKLGTVLQLAVVMATLLAPELLRTNDAFARAFIVFLWWATAVVAAASCVDYVLVGVRQKREAKKR